MEKKGFKYLLIFLWITTAVTGQTSTFKGQGPIRAVNTERRPVGRQWKGTFEFDNTEVKVSNDFDGGRLSGIFARNDTLLVGLVNPENTPVNMSPWYAFKVWAPRKKSIYIRLTYSGEARHRYYPKTSMDGETWTPLDSTAVRYPEEITDEGKTPARPRYATVKLNVGPDTLWVAGQELFNSKKVYRWMDGMTELPFVKEENIGYSLEGRPMKAMTIGRRNSKHLVMVICRQHPPEVTGHLAMKAFVETIAGTSRLAARFRKKFTVYVVPLMNPDGVDNGYWRHNAGGIDLNRDWQDFNQPETRNVRDLMHRKVKETGGEFNFGIDFHSTWDDIYYTIDPEIKGNMPGLVYEWLAKIRDRIPGYTPNINSNDKMEPTIISRNYFYTEFNAESLVFEIGDNTSREFVEEKGKVGAEELMKLMLSKKHQ